jgi:hypothetical protein
MMEYPLISRKNACGHLRIDYCLDVDPYLNAAHAIVFEYVGAPIEYWSMSDEYFDLSAHNEALSRYDSVLRAAILMVLGELWLNRESTTANPLSDSVKNLLQVVKGPAYA